jgi:hypothetical protein
VRTDVVEPRRAAGPRGHGAARRLGGGSQTVAAHAAAQLVVEGAAGPDAEQLACERVLHDVVVGAREQPIPELEGRAPRAPPGCLRRADQFR